MKLLILAVTLLLGFAVQLPAADQTHPFSVEDMLAMQRISEPQVSPDGARVAFTLRTTDMAANRGRTDIWVASLAGGPPRRFTASEANDSSPRWSADGKALFFLSDRSGSSQVWRLEMEGGEAEAVTHTPRDIDAFRLVPGGQALVIAMAVLPGRSPSDTADELAARAKNPATGRIYDHLFVRHWDTWSDGTRGHLFAYDIASGKAIDLMPQMDADCPVKPFGGPEDFTISPDGKTLVFAAKDVGREEAWSTNFDLFAVPLDGSTQPQRLTTNPATDAQPLFSPDGRTLAYLAMQRPGYESDRYSVVLRPWPEGASRQLVLRADASPHGDRSPREMAWSSDGKELLLTADHLGETALFALDVGTGAARVLASDGTVVAPQSTGADGILFGRHSLAGPTELFVCDRGGSRCARVTHINDERVAAARMGRYEAFTFSGHGGDTVYGRLVYPADFDPTHKYPVALLIHGGPQGSFTNEFHYRWNPQAYAGAGYATLSIDFHGSTGYGQAFTDAIRGDWGGAPYEDIMKGLDAALAKWPFLDGSRVGALGASYGAYMINWIAGHTDRFQCLVTHDGNLDERMAYFDTDELWFPEWDHEGVPWKNPDGYTRHNPIDFVGNWKTPTLVVHGARDYRVVDTQGLSVFTALQRRSIPAELLYFPDESHWVLKPANSRLWHQTVIAWLDRWLKGDER
jgi:dipeptidyl aminopeptidase/acylaminoacyl peptidase